MKKSLFGKLDFILITLIITLVSIGLVAVYSATYNEASSGNPYFQKQLIFALIGFFLMLATAFIPYKIIHRLSYVFYGFTLFLLSLVLIIGVKGFGAERWISLAGIKLQPSELAKLATEMAQASYLSKPERNINSFKT